eukprot:scpid53272/ scgid5489/ Tyrosine-protein kinase SYK
MKDINLEQWFHGRILREEAEALLQRNGCGDGLFLVREMTNLAGDYALSLAFGGIKYHYQITRHSDGRVAIEEGQRFEGPVELVAHHFTAQDGLLTKLRRPLLRERNVEPMGYKGVTHAEMEAARRQAVASLASMGFRGEPHEAIAKFRRQVEQIVGAVIQTKQPWFHGKLTRVDAEKRMNQHLPLKDGCFLVRERDQQGSYAVCLAHRQTVFHYLLDIDVDSLLSISNGRKFDTLLAVVDHYSRKPDGLLCPLTDPIPNDEQLYEPTPVASKVALPDVPGSGRHKVVVSIGDDMPDFFRVDKEPGFQSIFSESSDQGVFEITPSAISTEDQLGSGNFGSVLLGTYSLPRTRKRVQVAVKMLKVDDVPNQRDEILREAQTMAGLDHPHIVRLVGVVKSNPMMLVMEIAHLGPLHKFLRKRKNREITWLEVLSLMLQVAVGMAYLEEKRFVHRDLAARNVLCVTPRFCKISDFGMSRALGLGNDYYRAEVAGRWPLKWYAPECIYFFKFDTKSDVWSFGVTLWEALSFGDKPYFGRKGTEILRMLEDGERLDCPAACPPEVYQLMTKCWSFESINRPSFKQVLRELKSLCKRAHKGEIRPADLYLPMRH